MSMQKIIISLSGLLLGLAAGAAHASTQETQLPMPEVRVVDPFGVNLQTHQVTASQETVSIGGERGLSHSISMLTNHFSTGTGGMYGYLDKYAGNAKYVVFGEFPGVVGFACAQVQGAQVWMLRVSGPEGSEDFKVMVNGTFDCNASGETSYSYEALGDKRNILEVIQSSDTEYATNPSWLNWLRWTRPDGTRLYYERTGTPIHAASVGRLRQIVYPNGFTIDIDRGNVITNTGFHLKYEYDISNLQGLSSQMQSWLNQLESQLNGPVLVPDSSPGNFAQANPKRIRAVNRAFNYCTTDTAQTCASLTQWPVATFTWHHGGMPRAFYLLNQNDWQSDFSVVDAQGRTTEYHYQAHDVMLMENGQYGGNINGTYWPYKPSQVWSPRLMGIKSAGSSVVDRQFQYRTRFVLDGNGGTNFWKLVNEEGEVKTAQGLQETVTYGRAPMQSGGEALLALWHQGTYRVEPADYYPGRISFMMVPKAGQYNYEAGYRNLISIFTPYDSPEPSKNYTYDGRGNLIKIRMRPSASDETFITAGYLSSCAVATRKICNKPTWVSRVRLAGQPDTPDPSDRTDYTYDSNTGQVLSVTGPADNNGIRPVTRYQYSNYNARYKKDSDTITQDSRAISLLRYERTCRSTATVGSACAGGPLDEVVTEYNYDTPGGTANNLWLQSVSVTAEVNGVLQTRTTCYEYDKYGNRIGETKPKGTAGGCSTSVPQQPAPYKYAKRYTSGGQLVGEISPDPDGDGFDYPAVRHTYDSRGLLTKTEHGILISWQNETVTPASWSGFTVSKQMLYTYDSYGRKVSESLADPLGNAETLTQQSYDTYNRLDCKTVRLNLTSAPGNACTLGTEGEHGPDRITRFEYNSADNVLRERRAVGTDLEQIHLEYTYDTKNRVVTVTDANDNTAKFEYDNYSRKTKWCFPAAGDGSINCNDYESYAYDENGNRTSLRKRDAKVILYQYDKLNRMVYKNIPNTAAFDVYYGYELTGAQLFARFGSTSGQGITTNYTGFGEPEQETVNLNSVTRMISRQFDANGNRTRITHPDHVQSTNNRFFVYQYDGLDRLQTIGENGSTTILITDTYDNFERPDSRTTAGGAMTWLTYNDVSRLSSLNFEFGGLTHDLTIGYGYNPAGQLAQHNLINSAYHHTGSVGNTGGYVVNGLNQYESVNGVTFAYDANGNLTDDGPNTYTYDVENRLLSAAGTASATLSYDPMGRLNRYVAGGVTTDFVYDGDSLIAEYVSGSVSKRYVHGTSVDTPLVQYVGSTLGTRQFLHKNHQGSVIGISGNSGTVANINTYDSYGVPGTSNSGRIGYTGQMYLSELKLYHYRARIYNPHIGRFLQVDPVGYADQMNMYAYVGNDPLNHTDPTGMFSWGVCSGGPCIMGLPIDQRQIARQKYPVEYAQGELRSAIPTRSDFHQIGEIASLGLTIAAVTTPCTAPCGVSSFVIDGILAIDHLMHGELKDAALEMVPGTVGAAADASLKATKILSSEAAGRVGAGVDAAVNTVIEAANGDNNSSSSSNSDNGMSGGNVTICSGMGAIKGGC